MSRASGHLAIPSSLWRCGLGIALAGGVLMLLAADEALFPKPTGAAEADSEATPFDPVPLRRVLIPPERLPAELERVRQRVLMQLDRGDFESRLKQARETSETLRHPPRLLEARYSATVTENALVNGTGVWRVHNPASKASILPLPPLNLALQNVRWQNGSAVLGDLDGKALGLLTALPGEQALFFDWSARGSPSPGSLRFDLRLPPCALATLELRLPADRAVLPADGFLLSGPHPAETADRRLWRLECSGQSALDVIIRRVGDAVPALTFARLASRYEIEPDQVRSEFDFDFEIPLQGMQEVTFECDAGLAPYEVNVKGLESWEPRGGARPGQPTTLKVRLSEFAPEGRWPCRSAV